MTKLNRNKKIVLISAVILLPLATWLGYVWLRIYERSPERRPYDGEPIKNILILGIDQLDNEPSRADSIIILSKNTDSGDVSMVSIPRDSRVEIQGYGLDKINHAMALGGVDLMRSTVEQLMDVPLHYYVYTNFAGFEKIIDTLGGVQVNVEREIIGTNGIPILEPGPQHLSGSQALTYVRFRSDAKGDFGRMRRQQQILKAIATRMMQPQSIVRLPALLEQLADDVRTDLPPARLLSLGTTVASQDIAEINTVQLRGTSTLIDGISYVILDVDFLRQTVDRYIRRSTGKPQASRKDSTCHREFHRSPGKTVMDKQLQMW
ncbi:MAG: LCP family protein [Bacillota bacterium]|nr:LCP family protein [Bacillota bacterium]MDW7684805.1 LCP family protein [Bacillota bacterium]